MRAHKFGAQKATVDGQVYDSKAEGKDAVDLRLLLLAGEIQAWTRGENEVLLDGEKHANRIHYRPDFVVTLLDGSVVWVDRKGFVTTEFRMKQKMWANRYPERPLLVVKKGTSIRQALQQHQAPPTAKPRKKAA